MAGHRSFIVTSASSRTEEKGIAKLAPAKHARRPYPAAVPRAVLRRGCRSDRLLRVDETHAAGQRRDFAPRAAGTRCGVSHESESAVWRRNHIVLGNFSGLAVAEKNRARYRRLDRGGICRGAGHWRGGDAEGR